MSEQKKRQSMSRSGDPNPLDVEENRPVDTWSDPGGAVGGTVSSLGEDAEDETSRPRDKEAAAGGTGVVPGFTNTGSSGSQSGRSLYGIAPEDENPEGE